MGVRDPTKIPTVAEVTSEDLMIHEVGILLESVIEPGWYNASSSGKRIAREDDNLRDGNIDKSHDPKKSRTDGGDEQTTDTNGAMQQHGADSSPHLMQQLQQIRAAQDNILAQVNRQHAGNSLEMQVSVGMQQHDTQGGNLVLQHSTLSSDGPGVGKKAINHVPLEPVLQEVPHHISSSRLGFGSLSLTAYEHQQKQKEVEDRMQCEGANEVVDSDDVPVLNCIHKGVVIAEVSALSDNCEVDEFESQPDIHKSYSEGEEVQDSQIEET